MSGDNVEGVRRQYRREAARYDRRWDDYLEGTIGPTLAAVDAPPGRLLDVGCGTGVLLERVAAQWPEARAVGLDASPQMLARARRRLPARVPLLLGDVHHLPFPAGRFDTVVSSSSLHHWADAARALREIARVTRPGGLLVLTDWSGDHPPLRLFGRFLRLTDPSQRHIYRRREAQRLLAAAGFRVRSARRFRVGWLWGMMTLSARRC